MGGGGPTGPQRTTAAGNLSQLGTQALGQNMQNYVQGQSALRAAEPVYANEAQFGLPFYRTGTDYAGGTLAQAYAPQYGAINRETSTLGTNTPSGYRAGLMNNMRGQQAGQFDQQLMALQMAQQNAKNQGAAGLTGLGQIYTNTGLGYGQLGAGASQGLLQIPQAPSPWAIAGGAALGGLSAYANA